MEKTNFTQMMRWVKGTVLAVVAVMSIGLQQADAQGSCYDAFTVPLDDSCKATISLDMIGSGLANTAGDSLRVVVASPKYPTSSADNTNSGVEGEICAGDKDYFAFTTALSSAQEADIVYGEGTWMYGVYAWDHEKDCWQLYCWGSFKTEDKADPHFVGDTTGLANVGNTVTDESVFRQYGTYERVEYLTWDGSLPASGAGQTFEPGIYSCWQSTNHADLDYSWPTDSTRTFDTIQLRPTETGLLTLIAASRLNSNNAEEAPFDPVVAVYEGSFDSDNPCQNLVAFGESSFIPNPLAGLGFTSGLSNSSIDGAFQDSTDIFAPWLLHENPVVRMDVKIAAGKTYYVLVSHREDTIPSGANFELYFMLNDYNGQIQNSALVDSSGTVAGSDSLLADTSFSYFEFLCADVDKVMLDNQVNVTQTRYTGGDIREMANWLGGVTGFVYANGDTYANREKMNTAWRQVGEALVGVQDKDTTLIDLTHYFGGRGSFAASQKYMDSILYHYGFMPMVIENCDEWTVNITDVYNPYGDCGVDQAGINAQGGGLNVSGIIDRTFVVTDGGTKTDKDTARIQLVFRNPNLYDVRLPHLTVNIECDEMTDGIVNTDPSSTGYPFVSTLAGFVDLTPTNAVCNLAAGYEDVARVETCANTYKFRREWTVYDWCRPGTTVIYHQLIKVGDWTAPVFKTAGTIKATQNPAGCDGTITVTAPVYTDNCGTVTYTAKLYAGDTANVNNEVAYFATGAGSKSGLAMGKYTVVWTATDACGNVGLTSKASATIVDNIAPSCVIDDLRSITLTDYGAEDSQTEISTVANRGQAWVTAARIDEGSWDNCGTIDSIHVRRMTTTGMSPWHLRLVLIVQMKE